ncbi:MAG: TonB-dependent receptor plug domain-containing protein [Bryobacteraceae bacterium]
MCASRLLAEQKPPIPADLTSMPLEDLMQIEVTSVSKRQQRLTKSPAAVYVITQEDIRRSGVTSIPEALRMAPGVQVARIDSSTWAISARGFNGRYSDKLLVMIDGRTVYTPLFKGVFWDQQDLFLEDIDRIEVIRGPGATMWGANAVNGVIHIITRDARDTQGGLAYAMGGNEERGTAAFRYGGASGGRGFYRGWYRGFRRGGTPGADEAGPGRSDTWRYSRGGFRSDWGLSNRDTLTVQGDFFSGGTHQASATYHPEPPFERPGLVRTGSSGGNLLSRWRRTYSENSAMALQLFYDRLERTDQIFGHHRHTAEADFQHSTRVRARHDLLWGATYRFNVDRNRNSFMVSTVPEERADNLFTWFLQDEVQLTETTRLTIGAKFEHNNYTGFEFQPGVRFLWEPTDASAFWAAASRSVGTPSRTDHDMRVHIGATPLPFGLTAMTTIQPNPGVRSQELHAHEAGYRRQMRRNVSVDVSGFFNVYHNLIGLERFGGLIGPNPFGLILLPLRLNNVFDGRTFGVETAVTWTVTPRWRLSGNQSLLRIRLKDRPESAALGLRSAETESPGHQHHLRSYLNLTKNLEFDTFVYYVGPLKADNIPSYTRVDLRFGWRLPNGLEFSLNGQNLLGSHAEFFSEEGFVARKEIGRSAYAKIAWRF